MHAAGNLMRAQKPDVNVFTALRAVRQQHGARAAAERYGRLQATFPFGGRALDRRHPILRGKNTTQEEFFHTFNALIEGKQQIILTCDRYPKEVENLEPR